MKKKIHNYKVFKIIQLCLFLILELLFLFVLISNKTMKSSIFVDKSLFTLCMIMYISSLFLLVVLLLDFIELKRLKRDAHDLERLAYLDNQTGIPNRTSVNMLFDSFTSKDALNGIGCVITEISNIRSINTSLGKEYGDKIIRDFSILFEQAAQGFGFVGRNGGNEYITVIKACSPDRMEEFYKVLKTKVDEYNSANDKCNIELHSEYVLYDSEQAATFSELVAKAYAKLRS